MTAYTEEEAKMKWCPFARTVNGVVQKDGVVIGNGNAGFNRVWFTDDDGKHRIENGASICVGSACMAWRWVFSPESAKAINEQPKPPAKTCVATGYCGLGGSAS